MTTAPQNKKRRLGEILIDAGVLNELQLRAALAEQRKWGGKLGRTLVEMKFVDEQSMVMALSRQLHLPAVDLEKLVVTPELLSLLKVDLAERYSVFPVSGDRKTKTLQVAASDPTNFEALQELSFSSGLRVQSAVASEQAIERAIRKHYYGESVTSSTAASPTSLGVEEIELDGETFQTTGSVVGTLRHTTGIDAPIVSAASRPGAPAVGAAAISTPSNSADAVRELTQKVTTLSNHVAELEKLLSGQGRAMRGILELMIEKRLLTREEYLAKLRVAAPPVPAAPQK